MERAKVSIKSEAIKSRTLKTLALVALALATLLNLHLLGRIRSGGVPAGQLRARRPLEAGRVLARGRSLGLASNRSVRLQAAPDCPLLELDAARLAFPGGLDVRAGHARLECADGTCVPRAPIVQLGRAGQRALDLGGRSLQLAGRLRAGRLHSATGRLRLLAAGGAHFAANSLKLWALDDVQLAARRSLTLEAKRVGLSSVASGSVGAGGYKLCVCPSKREQRNWGLVFGVASELECSSAGGAFCR